LEGTVVMDSAGTASLTFNRDTFLGLSSDSIGTLVLGQHDTPYKMATRRLDMFADGIADNRGNQSTSRTFGINTTLTGITTMPMMGGGHDTTIGNLIAYISPSMSGFSIAAAGVFGAETAIAGDTKGRAYSLAGMYDQGPFYATLAYDTARFGSPLSGDLDAANFGFVTDDESKAFKVGGSYSMDAFAVNAVIERITNTMSGADYKNTNYYLAGKFNISSTDDVKLAYTRRGDTTGNTDNAKQYTVGYDHSLSKATSVYALYTKLTDNGTHVDPTFVVVGNADSSALSFGIKHSF
jgi:predicted porin